MWIHKRNGSTRPKPKPSGFRKPLEKAETELLLMASTSAQNSSTLNGLSATCRNDSEFRSCKSMAPPQSIEIASTEGAQESSSNPKFPFLSLIPKFPLGFLKLGGGGGGRVDVKEENKAGEVEDSGSSVKPNAVRFRLREPEVEPLRLHSEDAEHNSNPLVVWQV